MRKKRDSVTAKYVEIDCPKLKLHYLEAGEGEPVLLLHGWPTSSYLWRNIIGPLARTKRVIALDLPGFGNSGKPIDAPYNFGYYEKAIEAFLEKLGIQKLNLVVHDLGGPVGLFWAVRHPEKIQRLGLLNTLVYPRPSWAVILFIAATFTPGLNCFLSSARGIAMGMKLGVERKEKLTQEVLANYQAPFQSRTDRKVLLKTAQRLSPRGMIEIAKKLRLFDIPVCAIYGERDRILPDVASTMRRVKHDLPQTQIIPLKNCGHFLQEDEPEIISELLAEFLKK